MCFDAAEFTARLCRPHKHGAVVTACDNSISVGTKNHCIDDRIMSGFAIAFLILKPVGHDKLGVNTIRAQRPHTRVAEQRDAAGCIHMAVARSDNGSRNQTLLYFNISM